jgi:6,7-dimethyl-8-ribityllumazine synthase
MTRILEGRLNAEGVSFGIVVGRFNSLITTQLLDGALDCLRRHGAREDDITVAWCPGSFEIPQVALQLAQARTVDAVICLGCVIRGETPHFDVLAAEVTKGVAQVGLQTGVPTTFGVLTTENLAQALERAGAKSGNKGWDAAQSAIELVQLGQELSGKGKKKRPG